MSETLVPYFLFVKQLEAENARLRERLEQDRAEMVELREALEGIRDFAKEHNFLLDMWKIVDACEQALSADAGRAYAERMRKLEAVAEAARNVHVWPVDGCSCSACTAARELHEALAALEVPEDGLRD